jgi:hypothetical protein
MKFQPTLQIAQNLFLMGDKVISYETHVATVEFYPTSLNRRPVLTTKGKYSRTTSKHIQRVRQMLDASLVDLAVKQSFYQFEFGAQCKIPGSISPAGSSQIIEHLRQGNPMEVAVAMAAAVLPKSDQKKILEMADDLPSLQNRIKRCMFLHDKGLIGEC